MERTTENEQQEQQPVLSATEGAEGARPAAPADESGTPMPSGGAPQDDRLQVRVRSPVRLGIVKHALCVYRTETKCTSALSQRLRCVN